MILILLIISRSFNIFPPDSSTFVNNGLHVETSSFIYYPILLVRKVTVSALSAFVFPYDNQIND
jgi:hypothetical protein